jgi:hypothetical protein
VTSEINLTAVGVSSIKKVCIDRKLNEPGKRKVIPTEHIMIALCLDDIHPKMFDMRPTITLDIKVDAIRD